MLMTLIAWFKKILSKHFVVSVEVSDMVRFSSEWDELRNKNSMGC